MEVKIEPSEQSLIKKYSKMSEKYGKLQQNYAKLQKEIAEVLKENAKLKAEMTRKDEKYKEQIAILNKELAKLKGLNHRKSRQHNEKSMIEENSQSGTFDCLPIGKTVENGEFIAKRMMSVQLDHQKQSQNLDNFTSMENSTNIIIKQQNYKNGDFGANFPLFQMPTTSSALDVEKEGNELIGLEEEEFADEESGRTIFADEMDLDDEEMNGISENEECGGNIGGQIECAPVKIGTIFKCNWPAECEYRTKRLRDMQRHWRTHTGERPYVCAECGRPFADATTFERHKLTHTDKRPYVCPECGQSFARPDTLKNHQLIHTGEKPHQCDFCGQSFRQSSGLRNHRRTHTGERPYVCEECGQSFKQSSSLKDHKRMHNKRWNNNRKN